LFSIQSSRLISPQAWISLCKGECPFKLSPLTKSCVYPRLPQGANDIARTTPACFVTILKKSSKKSFKFKKNLHTNKQHIVPSPSTSWTYA
jgi:hypothetical protein